MKRSLLFYAFVAAGVLAVAVPAAAATRAWVSGHGTDAAGCGAPTNPCRSLQYAHDNIIGAGGEIDILDPAGYGALSITKAISVINDGVGTAGVQATSGAAITVNAGPTDSIVLKGIHIEGLNSGTVGILVNSAGSVSLQDGTITEFTDSGVKFIPSSGGNSTLSLSGTSIYSNTNNNVLIQPSGGTSVRATLFRVGLSGSTNGVVSDNTSNAGGFVHTTVADSLVKNHSGTGVSVLGAVANGARAMVERTDLSHNGTALSADGANGLLDINASTIAHPTTVCAITNGATITTFNDNAMHFYTSFGCSMTPHALQ